ncbi:MULTISPECIES: MAE_28990/MAE_18760 family HEPN-like nuclease [Streptomyces]|uniref:MAE-28990/MAE-18760-like HEPN domain-containing protein n=1 Tax=Streptomyces koelreuteriae TaxID=2838015 RepID=A0ABX8FT53_9ACTN|nr:MULTISPECIES: MAE_28990/MAE_18760 family HEPN-like nuclease [Streptomyces]QWB24226.1 hypothetical protein KJK29_17390 [Streptomyces koelreuteriae]UUA07223.1 MAE_28990/MAE_18760 family HEPN-like nuclease [Streptomyces koelreuteriae]UUA14852.1 MAE_28990/MAE_18760 family HEPN-like nuclease [Streptomyces sp. CRCS-T-1]
MRAQLEEDLAWRLDELRHLRNQLLGDSKRESWTAAAMRTILVMQYAHLEGFTRNSFHVYVTAINEASLNASELQPQLLASALASEFTALRRNVGADDDKDDEGRLTRRAQNEVAFTSKLLDVMAVPLTLTAEEAVSMEMNMGRDVLRRCLYLLAIPGDKVNKHQYNAIEFVKNARNDIAHGSRKERFSPALFEAHREKCEQFMRDLMRVITLAATEQWYKRQVSAGE